MPGSSAARVYGGSAVTPRLRRVLKCCSAVGLIVVLLVSGVLARFLSVENAERDAIWR